MAAMRAEQLAQWYEAYGAELLLYARQLANDQQAEDVVQEAFIKLMRQRMPPDHVRAWLYRVVRNESVSLFRRLRATFVSAKTMSRAATPWFESRTEDLIDAQTVQSLLETLAKPAREIVLLRIWGQLSFQEIAGIVNKPISTVHRLYQAALETMKQQLEPSPCTLKRK